MSNIKKDGLSNIKIAQITSRHTFKAVRIRERQCYSIANAGIKVILVAPDAPEIEEGGIIYTSFNNNFSSISNSIASLWRLYKKTVKLKPDLVHFHDPDVIFVGFLLRLRGIKVVFDVHEDFPKLAYDRKWVPGPLKGIVSLGILILMKLSGLAFNGIISATPTINQMFPINKRTVIRNVPKLNIFNKPVTAERPKPPQVCYAGGMSESRGFHQMISAIDIVNKVIPCNLILAGTISEKLLKKSEDNPGWKYTKKLGFVSREEVSSLYSNCEAGLVVLEETKNHKEALPIKMFEYMAAGLPTIASNFPLWENIIEENKCGICVPPNDVQLIADAIIKLVTSKELRMRLGENGRRNALEKFNWELEEQKLLNFYQKLFSTYVQ